MFSFMGFWGGFSMGFLAACVVIFIIAVIHERRTK